MRKFIPLFLFLGFLLVTGATYTVDQLFRGNDPAAAGKLACSTNTTNADWLDVAPTACDVKSLDIDEAGSTTTSPSLIGWDNSNFQSGTAMRLVYGNPGGGSLQAAFGDKMELSCYHGIVLNGGLASVTAPSFATGNGSSDTSVEIIGSAGGGALKISTASNTGTAIIASYAGTFTTAISPATVAANSTVCGSVPGGAVAVTGVVAGRPCFVGAPSNNNLIPWCRTTSGNLNLCFTNPTGAALAPPANVPYVMRDFE